MSELITGMKRTSLCGLFTESDIGREVTLMGWCHKNRDLGGVIFIDLRDRSGVMQVVFNMENDAGLFEKASSVRSEYVIAVKGMIVKRDEETINENIQTGTIELRANELRILSEAKTPPIYIEENTKANEGVRLKNRYIDLRRPDMQKNIILRHETSRIAREYFYQNGFLEIETPMLTKSTPEGARDYLVPSRLNPGNFYALPQSPQIFKQLLMVSGFDRYIQIVKCFRDEDLRADRQPEFTQIDLEMSFVNVNDVIEVNEGFLKKLFKETLGVDISTPLRRIPYKDAMERYGSDKPDTRFGFELVDISDIAEKCGFKVFSGAVEKGGSVRLINAKECAKKLSRREIDALVDFVKIYQAKGMAWIAVEENELKSPIIKFLEKEEIDMILKRAKAEPGDLICFIADKDQIVFDALGNLRLKLAEKLDLLKDNKQFDLLWVTEFPLLEYSPEEKRHTAMHHPFTAPMDEDIKYLDSSPLKVRAKAYDIILNGNEIGGGSIRIHSQEMQNKMFGLLGFTDEEAQNRFGFLLDAFKYGTPPHGGLAYGMDRIVMLLAGCDTIRDVIAFPKLQNAACPLSGAPDSVDKKQLEELKIKHYNL